MPYKDPEKERERQRLRRLNPAYRAKQAKLSKSWQLKNRALLRTRTAARRAMNPQSFVVATQKWQRAHPEVVALARHHRTLADKGVTPSQFALMVTARGNRCDVCGELETATRNGVVRRLSVDHSHITGVVRGLLCMRCNSGIAMLGDHFGDVQAALMYLQRPVGRLICTGRSGKGKLSDCDRFDLLHDQLGVCAICFGPEQYRRTGVIRDLSVDHCHETERVRGLLCQKCNTGLGLLGDSAATVSAAAKYLSKFQ